MTDTAANPLLSTWDTPHGLPPFAQIRAEHFPPALETSMQDHWHEMESIAANEAPPSFENTIAALDRSGRMLTRATRLFFNLTASHTSPDLQAVERDLMPRLASHHNAVMLHAGMFARIDALHRHRTTLDLAPEALRLLERTYLDFVHAGARLDAVARLRLTDIGARLAALYTQFRQNELADEASYGLVLRTEADLAGLPESLRASARAAAQQRGVADAWVITLSRSLVVPFLTYSSRRDLRKEAFTAWTHRGESDGARDNRPVVHEILALRHELAHLQGYASYADYALVDRMARKPAAVADLLARVWEPAKTQAMKERDALQDAARARGDDVTIEPWDWRYYAEQVRATKYDFDAAALKPYFSLDRMLAAAFDCALRLFGIHFVARPDLVAYHPDVRIFEVRDRADAVVGVFLSDNFARPEKRGGAWMSLYRAQSRTDGEVLPIVVNNNNFAKAPDGEPTLLSTDDVRTLFHEFGHGLHGLLSQVTYARFSGTNVLKDFVEFPSQIFEHWALEPDVLRRHALHHATSAPIPDALLQRFHAARQFNQGFETVEYTACALVDMALHAQDDPAGIDITAFEAAELARIGMPREIVLRHRLPHFGHLFGGSGYAAGYYVYMWAEVLDADGYDAFAEAGDPFDPELAARLLKYVYSAGGSRDPGEAYRAFRGRDPRVEPLLEKRGLTPVH
ncbi:MAG: M3 family metallopeptidase [Casimicrobiaceae bacterium]